MAQHSDSTDFVIEDNIIKCPDYTTEPYPTGLGYELLEAMKHFKDRVAQYVVETGEAETFGSFLQSCVRTALKMRSMGVSKEHVVCLCTLNHKHAAVPFVASILIGAKPAPISPLISATDAAYLLDIVTPRITFADSHGVALLEDVMKFKSLETTMVAFGPSTKWTSFEEFLNPQPDEDKFEAYCPENLQETAIVMFSSGTTGLPKGVCLNHYTVLQKIPPAKSCPNGQNPFSKDVQMPIFLIFSSFYWISAVQILLSSLLCGYARIADQFSPAELWKTINKYQVSMAFLNASQIAEVLRYGNPDNIDVPTFKVIATGGSLIPEELISGMKQLLPGVTVLQGYGCTEMCGMLAGFNMGKERDREALTNKRQCCGFPIKGIWYKIVDPETGEVLGANQKGELLVKSKAMVHQFYNSIVNPLDSDGWLSTGDLVRYDEEGAVYVVDRLKDMLKYKNYQIAPFTIEAVVSQHPAVKAAAVVGIPDVEYDLITAVVVLKDGCRATTPEDIRVFVDERVDDMKKLRGGVKIVQELPMTPSDKVKKRVLKELIMSGKL